MTDVFKAVVIARHSLSRPFGEAIYSAIKLLMRLLQSMKNRSRKDETSMVGVIIRNKIDISDVFKAVVIPAQAVPKLRD